MCCACKGGKTITGSAICTDKDFPPNDSSLYSSEELKL